MHIRYYLLQAAGYSVDVDDWHAAVHDTLAYEQLLQEDPQLRDVLARLTLQKHVLTNADARHAVKVFKQLGVSDCFQVRAVNMTYSTICVRVVGDLRLMCCHKAMICSAQ